MTIGQKINVQGMSNTNHKQFRVHNLCLNPEAFNENRVNAILVSAKTAETLFPANTKNDTARAKSSPCP